MHITKVPEELFTFFFEKFGEAASLTAITTRGTTYSKYAILANDAGAIGFVHDKEHTKFAFWSTPPRGNDDVFESWPTLEIAAGPIRAGVWAAGKGQKMVEVVRANFQTAGFLFHNPGAVMVATILQKANEIFEEKKPTSVTYWEADRKPSYSYDRP